MQIDDVSPTTGVFTGSLSRELQCPSGKTLCVAIAPDGTRAYVGGHSGVWRSDDGGVSWWHPEWLPATPGAPTRPGALLPPNVYDLAIHPSHADVVFAAASHDMRLPPYDGVYRSTDGALTWSLAHQFRRDGDIGFVGCLAVAPDDPNTIYAAGSFAIASSVDGGTVWTESVPPGVYGPTHVTHVAVAAAGPSGRQVYAVGDASWYSSDGGATWQIDPFAPTLARPGAAATASARTLAVHPLDDHIVYLMRGDLVLNKGVYPPGGGPAVWTTLPPPPIAGGTDSGCTFIIPQVTASGAVVLYVSDRRSVHTCLADPAATENYARVDFGVHVDPHGIAFSADFHGWGPDYNPPTFGRAILVNDGGAMLTTDGIQSWQQGAGLSTLNAANVAINSVPGLPVAITYGGGDDLGFFTRDDGATWFTQDYLGGDNDCQYADPVQPTRMVVFAPRSGNPVAGEIYLYVSTDTAPPDTALGTAVRQRIPAPTTTDAAGTTVRGWNVVSNYAVAGYRPLILTRHGETPRPDGDLVTIRWTGVPENSQALLLRTTALSAVTAPDAWVTTATAEGPGVVVFQVGPPLPDNGIGVVQGSGGHDTPTFYVGTVNDLTHGGHVWRLDPGGSQWHPIVPGTGPSVAYRFFVDPYRPQRIYVLADDAVYRSGDGGRTWAADHALDAAITENGAFPRHNLTASPNPDETVLRDMQFDPVDPNYRLALGIAGVFLSQDGVTWSPLLRSSALALQPTSMIYDPMGCERALYVGTMGRGILRLRPLPPDWEFPIGSLQAATGHITLLRVHELGSGYGPPNDQLDTEIIVWLDTEPGKAFGLQLRDDANGPAAAGMLDLLRDCFNRNRPVRLDFVRSGCRTGTIMRVFESLT